MTAKKRFTLHRDSGLAAPTQQLDRTYVQSGGRRLSYFAGCDYFRMASHPEVIAAIHAGLDRYGLNVAASRRTTGNHRLYGELERVIARFFRVETATLLSTGYMTNLCVAQALAEEITHVLLDELAHGSLYDAAAWLGVPKISFRHRDPDDVRRAAAKCGRKARILLLTDGLFAHSGEVAPIHAYQTKLPRTARILVDDTHAAGVLGRAGRGTLEHLGVRPDPARVIQTVTLSKAFGVYGGAVLGSARLRQQIIERSAVFLGNTPLPLPLVTGALQSVEIVRTDSRLRRRVIANTAYLKAALRESGLAVSDGPGPIVVIQPSSNPSAARLRRALLQAGIHPPWIHYHGAMKRPYFRFALSSEHDASQMDALVQTVTQWARRVADRGL